MNRWLRVLFAGIVVATLFAPHFTAAQSSGSGLIIDCDRADIINGGNATVQNRCDIEDFVQQFVRLGQYGITIVVFLAALMLVYGGFEFITAGGRQTKISSGQNIISGTVIGLIISFSAYVIINFSVGAITGTQTSTNPFTAIATVFGRPDQKSAGLTKPFSGDGAENTPRCREEWDTSCSNHILCADPAGENSGPVSDTQARLNQLGCGCGDVDSCYGEQTLTCVRRFQIANSLVPTGTVNAETSQAMGQNGATRCDGAATAAQITATLAALPRPTANVADVDSTTTGCCVVQKAINSVDLAPLYCINDLNKQACAALGSNYFFVEGKQCAADSETIPKCGFCRTADDFCIQEVGQYWCTNVAKDTASSVPITFEKGVCAPGGVCAQGCDTTLKATF